MGVQSVSNTNNNVNSIDSYNGNTNSEKININSFFNQETDVYDLEEVSTEEIVGLDNEEEFNKVISVLLKNKN